MKNKQVIEGAKFKPRKKIFTPTTMSVALANAGVIPAPHLVHEMAKVGLLRDRNDNLNIRDSVRAVF